MFQDAPPPAVAPAPPERLSEVRETFVVVARDRGATLSRGGRTEEALVRQHVFMTVVLKPAPVAGSQEVQCNWAIRSAIQRQICFRSISGIMGCTEPSSSELPENGEGALSLTSDMPADEAVCDGTFLPMIRMQQRLTEELKARSDQLFEEDLRLRVSERLTAGGAKVRWN